jgi:hypothetical protein
MYSDIGTGVPPGPEDRADRGGARLPPDRLHPGARPADRPGVRLRSPHVLAAIALGLRAASATADAERALLGPRDVGAGFEVVLEAPIDPAADPDMRDWGVREKHVRHYTRDLRGNVEVCSVEVWAFASDEQASAAEAGFSYPDWQISRAGSLLVMAHGLVRPSVGSPRRGVFEACGAIAGRVLERAAAL